MGLDMYANLYRPEDVKDIHVDTEADRVAPLFYWRKHPNLHGWMQRLYRAKGGKDHEFNCNTVRLDTADLDELERVINAGKLPETSGFFFGESCSEHEEQDREFLKLARSAIADGYVVFYDSWW